MTNKTCAGLRKLWNVFRRGTYHEDHDTDVGVSEAEKGGEGHIDAQVDDAHDDHHSHQNEQGLPLDTRKGVLLHSIRYLGWRLLLGFRSHPASIELMNKAYYSPFHNYFVSHVGIQASGTPDT